MFQKCWTCALQLFRETSVCLWECVCRCVRLTHAVSASAFVLGLCFVSKIHWQSGQMSFIVVTLSLDNWTRSVCLSVCSGLKGLRTCAAPATQHVRAQTQATTKKFFGGSSGFIFWCIYSFLNSISRQKLILHLLSKNPPCTKQTGFQLTVIQEKQKRCRKSLTEAFVQDDFVGFVGVGVLYFPLFWVLPLTQIWSVQLTPWHRRDPHTITSGQVPDNRLPAVSASSAAS